MELSQYWILIRKRQGPHQHLPRLQPPHPHRHALQLRHHPLPAHPPLRHRCSRRRRPPRPHRNRQPVRLHLNLLSHAAADPGRAEDSNG